MCFTFAPHKTRNMETIYLLIVVFLLCLAVFDLFVGVSNDAVNFLQSAIGAKVATFKVVLIVASLGVLLGATMSSGMMDVTRHGIMLPAHFSYHEVMIVFLAVMVTDVIVLDMFNSLGMPTSTTVSLVFELLGGAFVLAMLKMHSDPSLAFSDLLNTDKALSVIIAIFVSVAVAFFFGVVVQWISRIIFTFNYSRISHIATALFGGVAFTALSYFIFLKGLGKSPYISADIRDFMDVNITWLLCATFVVSSIAMLLVQLVKVNVFKFVVLMGTFALAMAFAGNDLVNFIGVPLAGLDSYLDFTTNAQGVSADSYLMTSLMESAKTPPFYLLLAGVVMIIAMATSKKAQNVIKTSVDLSRQDEGDEMFGSSLAARSIVRFCQETADWCSSIASHVPVLGKVAVWVDSRFNKQAVVLDNGAAFDVVRAAVNLVLASLLITVGTNLKLPLSTTYVTFMVAMGSSLADRAWSRESAVFRVTGVISVIGGWFITAGVAFAACGIVALAMSFGGLAVQFAFIALVVFLLFRSNKASKKSAEAGANEDVFRLMMRSRDPEIVWDLLSKNVAEVQASMAQFAESCFQGIEEGLVDNRPSLLRRVRRDLSKKRDMLKKIRRRQILALRKLPADIVIERNTWFHVGINASMQYIYCLTRMLEPVKEHVDNNFTPLSKEMVDEFKPVKEKIEALLKTTADSISQRSFDNYRQTLEEADKLKDELSVVRKRHIDRMQTTNTQNLQAGLVYLNLLQESQQLLSNMRHQLRAVKKFEEN